MATTDPHGWGCSWLSTLSDISDSSLFPFLLILGWLPGRLAGTGGC